MPDPAITRFADVPGLRRRARVAIFGLIAVGHGLAGFALIYAFGGVRALVDSTGLGPVLIATVIPDKPPPASRAVKSRAAEGASGSAGRKASADQIAAPPPRLPLPSLPAAPVAGVGSETRSGASASGEATGGASSGAGTGSGGQGNGSGGRYVTTRPVKIAGDLVEADYPKAGRAARLGTSVIVVLTVEPEGRVSDCRVREPSGDPAADTITCKLARERFRFHPALDQTGQPIEAPFGWKQAFFPK